MYYFHVENRILKQYFPSKCRWSPSRLQDNKIHTIKISVAPHVFKKGPSYKVYKIQKHEILTSAKNKISRFKAALNENGI